MSTASACAANAAANASTLLGADRQARPRRGGRRSARGARRTRPRPAVQVERRRPSGPSPSTRRRCRRSARPAGCSARRAARRRCRSRPRASPRRRRRSRGGGGAPRATTRSRSIASRRIRSSTAWRSRFSSSSSSASRFASRSSSVSSSASAASGRQRRPDALIRGASRKPIDDSSTAAGSTPATRISARSPGFCVCARRRSPSSASARFSSTSGTTSATVASATTSRCRSRNGWSGAEQRLRRASRRRRCRRGPRTDSRPSAARRPGRRGTSRPGRWWSVTTTSSPSDARVLDLGDGGDAAVDGEHELEALLGEPRRACRRSGRSPPRTATAGATTTSAPSSRSSSTASAVAQMPSAS